MINKTKHKKKEKTFFFKKIFKSLCFLMETLFICVIFFMVIFYLLAFGLCFKMKEFWDSRNLQEIETRRPSLTILFCSTVVFRSVIVIPLGLFIILDVDAFSWYSNKLSIFISDLVGVYLTISFVLRYLRCLHSIC